MVLTLKALTFTIHKQNDCATVSNTKGTFKSIVDFLSTYIHVYILY